MSDRARRRVLGGIARSEHARHALLTSFVTYLGMGLSVASAPIIAQTLGSDGRGVLAGTFVVVQVVGWVAFLGLPNGLALQIEKRREVSFWGVLIVSLIGILAAVVTAIAAPVISNGDSRIELGIRIVAVILVFSGVSNLGDQLALLRGAVYIYNAIRACTLVLPSLVIVIMFVARVLTLESAFIVTLLGQILAVSIGVVVAVLGVRVRGRARIPWSFSIRIWFSTVFDSVGGRGDQLALTALTSAPVVGVYAVAVTCANAASGLAQALAQTSLTRFVRAARAGESASLARLTAVAVSATVLAGAAIVAILVAYGEAIFGPDFSGLPGIVAVLVLAGALQDVWRLRAARDTARESAGRLAAASAIGLFAMAATIVGLAMMDMVSGITMAVAFLTMCAFRLASHFVVSPRDR